ncbi:hypothetical protein OIO07_07690 [Bacillus paralicheniformis]|uniref:Uncharacterized protein n=2 Tax=Bacillus paralicheniformis TaxID=1648923 RepID=A0AAW6KG21_9BACI|nr:MULTISPECIES: hypothetical protein [Bacillus]AYQ17347.1 hypothetical protein D5285_15350 [Bacillus paralicheniformis]MCI4128234.1 hypothetical protein [Bacillus haynesii]MCR3888035.1 hypothetical protein [Bacillus paralicheniformis]MCV9368153.1 hypothetical protein [Bacillus paralicheniformis]MDE1391845.1 hypothetical protein [Bacillus paralicheniformis]
MSDAVIDMYNALEEIGYTQNQIDEMDILYHLRRLARRKEAGGKPAGEKEEKRLYIDQVLG